MKLHPGKRRATTLNANIGIAQAAYYPTLTLSATPGLLGDESAKSVHFREPVLVRRPSLSKRWSIWPPQGRRWRVSKRINDATVAGYRQDGSHGLSGGRGRSCESALSRGGSGDQQEAVVAAQEALSLEMERYRGGTDSYLNVITTQIIALRRRADRHHHFCSGA